MSHTNRIASLSLDVDGVEQWVLGHLGEIEHEHRVRCIARALFDLTHPLHQFDGSARQLLAWGALVHDVGRSACDDNHEAAGARMLLADRELDLTPSQRRALAFLTH